MNLIAIVSMNTVVGDHDGHCSGDECVDEYGVLDEIYISLKGHIVSLLTNLCKTNPHYLEWLVSELHLEFVTKNVGGGSYFCSPSRSGLQHEMSGTIFKIHSLELADDFETENLNSTCIVSWNDDALNSCPSFIVKQLLTLFLCVKRNQLPLSRDMRKVIGKIMTDDWFNFVGRR